MVGDVETPGAWCVYVCVCVRLCACVFIFTQVQAVNFYRLVFLCITLWRLSETGE